MQFQIQVIGANGFVKAQAKGNGTATLVYPAAYQPGDIIRLESNAAGFAVLQMEDSMPPVFGWLKGTYTLTVPFGEKHASYSPKHFWGSLHLLWARQATQEELHARRNLAYNPLDSHENSGFFPHASANVETRGESVFAARNAIDGIYANHSHGEWPFQSWGINRQANAEITIDFGRPVTVDAVVVTLRADFPHDNWWKQATLRFSDGSSEIISLAKTGAPQAIPLAPRSITWAAMGQLQKDETDPSPFPALTQIEFWGENAEL